MAENKLEIGLLHLTGVISLPARPQERSECISWLLNSLNIIVFHALCKGERVTSILQCSKTFGKLEYKRVHSSGFTQRIMITGGGLVTACGYREFIFQRVWSFAAPTVTTGNHTRPISTYVRSVPTETLSTAYVSVFQR